MYNGQGMDLTLHIPSGAEETIRRALGSDLAGAAKELLVVGAYSTGRLSVGQVREVLGLATRIEAEEWLGKRGVPWNYPAADLAADRQTLSRLSPTKP
jgi:predicted HTH domain antitoxin